MAKQGISILIVENEVIVADHIGRIAADLGCTPLNPAFSFGQAIKFFNEHLPDLVILDIRLKGEKTGIDFAKWLRKWHNTPIIYLTVFDDAQHIAQGQRTKPESYIVKPFVDSELRQAISQALELENEP